MAGLGAGAVQASYERYGQIRPHVVLVGEPASPDLLGWQRAVRDEPSNP
jgi:hypothetical protein